MLSPKANYLSESIIESYSGSKRLVAEAKLRAIFADWGKIDLVKAILESVCSGDAIISVDDLPQFANVNGLDIYNEKVVF